MPQERYFIGPGLRDKLRETIERVDGLMDSEGGVNVPTVWQEGGRRGGGSAIRLCTFTGAWPIGGKKTCTFKGTTSEVEVTNLFHQIGADCGERDAAIARVSGEGWILLVPECSA